MDWLSLLLLALMVAIASFQAIQGLVSALIMCVLVLICAPLAFATYEWVALSFLVEPLGDLALPAALMGSFVIPLIILRFAMDALISRANLMAGLIDRACAGLLGFVTAYLMTGVLAVVLQLIPFGG